MCSFFFKEKEGTEETPFWRKTVFFETVLQKILGLGHRVPPLTKAAPSWGAGKQNAIALQETIKSLSDEEKKPSDALVEPPFAQGSLTVVHVLAVISLFERGAKDSTGS